MKWKTKKEGAGLLELPCGFPVRFVGLFDLYVCGSESTKGEDDRKDGQQDADFIEVAVDFLFRLVPHVVVRAADAVQPFLSRQFSGVLLLFGRQRGIVLGDFLFLILFIHKPIL